MVTPLNWLARPLASHRLTYRISQSSREHDRTTSPLSEPLNGQDFSGGQTYFVIAIPRTGARYRVTVTSYDIAARH